MKGEKMTVSLPLMKGFDKNRPIQISSPNPAAMDETYADLGETFVLRQFGEDGKTHEIVLEVAMVAQVCNLMKSWMEFV